MRSLVCLRCLLKWFEMGRWPRRCPYCGSSRVAPAEEAS